MVKSLYGVMASFKKQSVARKRKRGESNSETASGANRLENEQNVEETYKKKLVRQICRFLGHSLLTIMGKNDMFWLP